jgi:hypothetical protein
MLHTTVGTKMKNINNLLTLSFQHLVISYNKPVNENHEASFLKKNIVNRIHDIQKLNEGEIHTVFALMGAFCRKLSYRLFCDFIIYNVSHKNASQESAQ